MQTARSATAQPGVAVEGSLAGTAEIDLRRSVSNSAALADLVQSEEALVAALSAEERGTLAAILRRLLTAQETRGR